MLEALQTEKDTFSFRTKFPRGVNRDLAMIERDVSYPNAASFEH